MSNLEGKIMWRRAGTTMDVKMEYKQLSKEHCCVMVLDERFKLNIFKRFLQWFRFMFLGGIRIIYTKNSQVKWG